ncbi:MAG: DUF1273 family protein [Oscillospiraceae bacterium]|nr:DUF1273 family protein [Oscillospiraceae bacterium]
MNRETTCCFTGPRRPRLPSEGNELSPEIAKLKEKIRSAVIDAYNDGFRFFMNGMADGFDLFAAETVVELKNVCSGISLVAVLPYTDAPKSHSAAVAKRMEYVLKNSCSVISLSEKYVPGCEHCRNKYMVDNSTRIIGYYNGLSGGTAHCWNYSIEKGLEKVNIYDET